MKYEQNIIFEDGGYVGYLLKNDEVIYFTPKCQTINVASSRLTNYIKKAEEKPIKLAESSKPFVSEQPVRVSVLSNTNPRSVIPNSNYQAPAKRCCGRG